jgi:hypothetical protein
MQDTILGLRRSQSSLHGIPAYFSAYRPQGCQPLPIRRLRRLVLAAAGRLLVLTTGRRQPS